MMKFVLIAALAALASAALSTDVITNNQTCLSNEPVLSCSADATPDKADTCCVETSGGLVLQTQLWHTYTGFESQGQMLPAGSWTIHGLWPGSYTQYCDLSRQYDPDPSPNTTTGTPSGTLVPPYKGEPIEQWFAPHDKLRLLACMKRHWVGQDSPSWELWAHEYSKHATCFSVFQPSCYYPRTDTAAMFDFFATVVNYHQALPTWRWLEAADIRPSNATAYTLADMQMALTIGYGAVPYIGCGGPRYNETDAGRGSRDGGRTQLREVYYYAHVQGRVQDGRVVPRAAVGAELSNCAVGGEAVWYFERADGSEERGEM